MSVGERKKERDREREREIHQRNGTAESITGLFPQFPVHLPFALFPIHMPMWYSDVGWCLLLCRMAFCHCMWL